MMAASFVRSGLLAHERELVAERVGRMVTQSEP